MLTKKQAEEIVHASIRKTPQIAATRADGSLEIGTEDDASFRSLVTTIVGDPAIGVRRFEHYLDPNDLADMAKGHSFLTVGSLINGVLELARGKLCSNPHNPHPQECCPYPTSCPQCGYPVL